MKSLFLAATTLFLIAGAEAREHWGPPSACPQPKADCCPKPCAKPEPKPCKPKACKPKCPPPVDPCCPPVCFERGYPAFNECKPCLPSAYVEPANFDVRCGWDMFVTASFTYWEAMQDGMDLALPAQLTALPIEVANTNITNSAFGNSVLTQDFAFKPGFQVGLGWSGGWDGWTFYGEYTWVRGETHTSGTPPTPSASSIDGVTTGALGVWIPTNWFPSIPLNNATNSISSEWEYAFDIADAQISRPSYIGSRFVFEPVFGARGLWIRQNLDIEAAILPETGVTVTGTSRHARYSSHSWAVGPRVGFNGNWHLGYGFRFLGDVAASLLYTRYTEVKQTVDTPNTATPSIRMKLDDVDGLRPNLDLSAGFGWGSYFGCRRVHFDFAATYDFSVFWQQNMMRYLADLMSDGFVHPGSSPSNLYLQGLTVKAAFEF